MRAQQNGKTVTLTMTVSEAAKLEEQLLWVSESDRTLVKAWEALNALHEG